MRIVTLLGPTLLMSLATVAIASNLNVLHRRPNSAAVKGANCGQPQNGGSGVEVAIDSSTGRRMNYYQPRNKGVPVRKIIAGTLTLGLFAILLAGFLTVTFPSLLTHFEGFQICDQSFPADASNIAVGQACVDYVLGRGHELCTSPQALLNEPVQLEGTNLPEFIMPLVNQVYGRTFHAPLLQAIENFLSDSSLDVNSIDWKWYLEVLDQIEPRFLLPSP